MDDVSHNNYIVPYRTIEEFKLFDLELLRLTLQGGSVFNWNQLAFQGDDAQAFCRNLGFELDNPADIALIERIRDEGIAYLSEVFSFSVPPSLRNADLLTLFHTAANPRSRHRRIYACTLLKAMHIINHFDAVEARQALKLADQELFRKAETRIYQTISQMMADRLPIVEFMGGRKQRASMVTKIISKDDPLSAQLFDKMRFRVVTATQNDVLPTISFLSRNLFPLNYILSGESYNTLFSFSSFVAQHPHLMRRADRLSTPLATEDSAYPVSILHSSPRYRVVHWVADMPIRIENFEDAYTTDGVNPVPRPVIYVRAEIQILDRKSNRQNERGDASHKSYKQRQMEAGRDKQRIAPKPENEADTNAQT